MKLFKTKMIHKLFTWNTKHSPDIQYGPKPLFQAQDMTQV